MPEYICSCCGNSFEAEPDQQGQIICIACGTSLPAESTPQALPAGTRIAGYEIIRHIAAGGCGSVYLAEQIAMERTVALKILNQEQLEKDNADRFIEEARNTAKFENPHVVSVIDTGISPEGFYYIAMQYVEGETLEEILQRGRVFSEEETLMIGLTVADALQSIWNKYRMFHKDIKPGNIMLTPENEAMILDMGTAQEHGESKLSDGNIEGSPYYMSPEQARGETLTWSTDLYSLGATMYQMLTGKYLYDGDNLEEILRQHDQAPFPEPSERVPEMHISEKMTALLRKMLKKLPSERYASWDEFIRTARQLLDFILEKKGSSVSGGLRKQYMALQAASTKPVLKPRNQVSPLRFVLCGLMIFIFGAALLGGTFLYLAAQKNSANARVLLEPIRRQTDSMKMDPDALEEAILKAAPYFHRLGVLPSIRNEFEKCRLKVKEFRELNRKEESQINQLETLTAEQLQAADREEQKAGEAARKSAHQAALDHFKKSMSILQQTSDKVKNTPFTIESNIRRARQLQERLATARQNTRHELRLLRQKHSPPAAGTGMKPAARIFKPAHPGKYPKTQVSPPPRMVSVGKKAIQLPEPEYRQALEQEMDRIRVELQLTGIPDKFKPDHPLWKLRFKRKNFPEPARKFDQWQAMLKRFIAKAAEMWNAVYNSRQTFAGFHFTIPTQQGDTRMELRTILKDEVILYHRGMPNLRLNFRQLAPAEWIDFLRFAAVRKGLQQELDSYLLLDGWFFMTEKSASVPIRQETAGMRNAFFRYLSGDKISGLQAQVPVRKELLQKYQADPVFAKFQARLKKNKSKSNIASISERKTEP